jgi:hypothetical protein
MGNVRNRWRSLGFELLEGRDCPAIFVFGGVMAVVGTSAADTVTITDDGDGTVTATLNGTTRTASDVRIVAVSTLGGDDTVGYTLTGTQSGRSAVAVSTGGGNDSVTLDAGDVGGRFSFAASGGAGSDTMTATVGGVAPGGRAAVVLDGGRGSDFIDLGATGVIDGTLATRLTGSFGADTIDGAIDVAAGSTGRVSATVAGGLEDDTLGLAVTGAGLDGLSSLHAVMDGGAGTDTGTATDNVNLVSIEF